MSKIFVLVIFLVSISFVSNAGCMTNEIDQINAKLEVTKLSPELKQEALRLRDLVIANEHSDRESADKFLGEVLELLS